MAKSQLKEKTTEKESRCIKILLADDHKILRAGLHSLIEMEPRFKIVAEAAEGRAAVRLCQELSPDVVIMDISMPNLNGIEATRKILVNSPKTKVIILSVHSSKHFVEEVFRAGATGYLLKNCSFEDLVSAIETVDGNETFLHPKIATIIHGDYLEAIKQRESASAPALSPREREVLQLIAEGKNTKEIAFSFDLSVKTVEAHRQRIMEKLNLRSVAELTKYAIREGLTTEEN